MTHPTLSLQTITDAFNAGFTLTKRDLEGYEIKAWKEPGGIVVTAMREGWDCPVKVMKAQSVDDGLVKLAIAVAEEGE